MAKWLKISHTGELRYVDLPDGRPGNTMPLFSALEKELNCEWIEFVRAHWFGETGLCLIVDECGKLKDDVKERVNHCASLMYAPGFDCIVGDAILGQYMMFSDGEYIVPLDPGKYKEIVDCLLRIFSDVKLVGGEENARV